MAWTRVQTVGNNQASGLTLAVTLSATAVGNLLVAFGVGGGSVSFSDGAGQTWTLDTEYSNINSSSKHYRWGWVLSTVAGVTTVTYTGGTVAKWLQVVEYSPGAGNVASLVVSSPTNFTNGTGSTTVGGTLGGSAASGSLVVIGSGENNEAATTFTAGTGISNLVGFGNNSNGTATICVGENLSSAASPVANLTVSPSNQEGATALAFTATPLATTDLSSYDPVRVPNPRVGPTVLRRLFRLPLSPIQEVDALSTGTSSLDFEGLGTANFQDPADSYHQVVLPNPRLGPPVLRSRDRFIQSPFKQDYEQSTFPGVSSNLSFNGSGTAVEVDPISGTSALSFNGSAGLLSVQDGGDVYREVRLPNSRVGPPALRRRFIYPQSRFKNNLVNAKAQGSGTLELSSSGTAIEIDVVSGTSSLLFSSTGRIIAVPDFITTTGPFYLKQGDNFPMFQTILTNLDGSIADLTNATAVTFQMGNFQSGTISKSATIVNASMGLVRYIWDASDSTVPGVYAADWKVTYADDSVRTFPVDRYEKIVVLGNLIQTLPID